MKVSRKKVLLPSTEKVSLIKTKTRYIDCIIKRVKLVNVNIGVISSYQLLLEQNKVTVHYCRSSKLLLLISIITSYTEPLHLARFIHKTPHNLDESSL